MPTTTVEQQHETSRIRERGYLISHIEINRHRQLTSQRANPSLDPECAHCEFGQCLQPTKLFPQAPLAVPKCFVYVVCFCGYRIKSGCCCHNTGPPEFWSKLVHDHSHGHAKTLQQPLPLVLVPHRGLPSGPCPEGGSHCDQHSR